MENGGRGGSFTKEPGFESMNMGNTGRNTAPPHAGAGETQTAPTGLVPAGGPVGVSVCLCTQAGSSEKFDNCLFPIEKEDGEENRAVLNPQETALPRNTRRLLLHEDALQMPSLCATGKGKGGGRRRASPTSQGAGDSRGPGLGIAAPVPPACCPPNGNQTLERPGTAPAWRAP